MSGKPSGEPGRRPTRTSVKVAFARSGTRAVAAAAQAATRPPRSRVHRSPPARRWRRRALRRPTAPCRHRAPTARGAGRDRSSAGAAIARGPDASGMAGCPSTRRCIDQAPEVTTTWRAWNVCAWRLDDEVAERGAPRARPVRTGGSAPRGATRHAAAPRSRSRIRTAPCASINRPARCGRTRGSSSRTSASPSASWHGTPCAYRVCGEAASAAAASSVSATCKVPLRTYGTSIPNRCSPAG